MLRELGEHRYGIAIHPFATFMTLLTIRLITKQAPPAFHTTLRRINRRPGSEKALEGHAIAAEMKELRRDVPRITPTCLRRHL